jgi:hypothetical protein
LANKCSYARTYYDYDLGREELYECSNEEHSKGRCKFHLKEYAVDENNREELIGLLNQEVEKANTSGSPLKWIGYQIPPDFAISSKFKVVVYLEDANFLGNTDFTKSTFERVAYFYGAQFNGRAHFIGATFSNEAYFNEAQFNEATYFSYAQFNEATNFDFSFEAPKGDVILSSVSLKEQEKITFNGDLSKVSFANTDITRVRFGDKVLWGRKKRNSANAKPREEEAADDKNKLAQEQEEVDFKIRDEWLIEENIKKKTKESPNSLESVIAEYRNLRENYEYNLRYEEAGRFFIREMELRRKYKPKSSSLSSSLFLSSSLVADNKIEKKNFFERIFSFAALYYFVSDYGESTHKPLAITISVFFIATLYFWYLKGWSTDTETISDSISRTLTALFPFFSLPEDYGLLDVVLRATMIPLAGLLFITLRRKLERRFRH